MARDVRIAILGDARDFTRAVGTANREASTLGGRLKGLSTQAKAGFAALGVAAVAFGKSSVDAFMEAETAQASLNAAYEKFPQLAGENASALRALNSELARKTKFDDDATASAQAVLASFGLTQDELLKVTPLLQDYAEKTGKDLTAAATDLGKATLGQGRAFKAIGLNFKDTGTKAGNLEQIMGGLNDKVGGFAEVAGNTTAGKVAILKNQFGELQERIGSALIPIITRLADVLANVLTWIEENQGAAQAIAAVVGGVLTAAFVAWGASVIAATWPIIAIGAAIAAVTAGVIYAYKNWDWFRNAVDAVARFLTQTLWPALQRIASFITGTLIPVIVAVIKKYVEFYQKVAEVAAGVVRAFLGVVNWFRDLPAKLGEYASKAWNALKTGLASVIKWIVEQIDRVLGPLDEIISKIGIIKGGGGGVGAQSGKVAGVPKMAKGGIVTRPTLALIGEAGPEAVVPLGRGGMGGNTYHITVSTLDARAAGPAVVEAIQAFESSNGKGWRAS